VPEFKGRVPSKPVRLSSCGLKARGDNRINRGVGPLRIPQRSSGDWRGLAGKDRDPGLNREASFLSDGLRALFPAGFFWDPSGPGARPEQGPGHPEKRGHSSLGRMEYPSQQNRLADHAGAGVCQRGWRRPLQSVAPKGWRPTTSGSVPLTRTEGPEALLGVAPWKLTK